MATVTGRRQDPVEAGEPTTRRRARGALALAGYVLVAALRYHPVLVAPSTRIAGSGGDIAIFVWSFGWAAHAVTHGLLPFHSAWIDAPAGANTLSNTTVLLLGVLFTPVTLLAGPVAAFNVALAVGYALSGFAVYLLATRWCAGRIAAFVAGLVVCWSGSELANSAYYPNLSVVACLPLIVLCLDQLLIRQDRPPLRWGAALGLLVIAQFFISSELLADLAELTVLTLAALAVVHRHQVRARVRAAASGLVAAAGIAAAGLAYPAWYALDGPLHVALVVPSATYATDLIGPFTPTSAQLLSTARLDRVGDHLSGNPLVSGGHAFLPIGTYIGLPTVAVAVFIGIVRWRTPLVRLLVVLAAATFVLSLGPRLDIDGHDTGVPLPAVAFAHIPLLRQTFAGRFLLFTVLAAALLTAIALEDLRGAVAGRRGRLAVGLLTAVVAGPLYPSTYYSIGQRPPPFFLSAAVRQIPVGSVVLAYPFPDAEHDLGMIWQADAGLRYRLVGGYLFIPGDGESSGVPGAGVTRTVLNGVYDGGRVPPLKPAARQAVLSDLARLQVDTVLVDPGEPGDGEATRFLTTVLGRGPLLRGGEEVWYGVRADVARRRAAPPRIIPRRGPIPGGMRGRLSD